MRVQRAWVLVVISLITLGFALATGHPMFWRTTYVFAALLAAGAVWVLVMGRGVDVDVRRLGLRAPAGGKILERVVVRRRSPLPKGVLEVWEQTTMPVQSPGELVNLDAESPITTELEVPCPQRGVYKIGPLTTAMSDPFGLFQVRRTVGGTQDLVIHPATVDLPSFVLLPADLPGEGSRHVRSNHVTTSAFGVRDYAHGDALNRISWKATAHHDHLMVKEFEVEPANNVWVLLDLDRRVHSGSGETGTEETSVRVAASICRRYSEAGYPVGFTTWGRDPVTIPAQRGPAHLVNLLDVMAGLHPTGNRPLIDLIADLQARAGRYTSVAIVTPAPDPGWLDAVAYLLERRARITLVLVERPGAYATPVLKERCAALGVPTYVACTTEEGLEVISASGPAMAWQPRGRVHNVPAGARR
jgi:uncharacterized protein (DUF58 family)